jgi:hypothetical protein
MAKFNNAKVGDKVWSPKYGWGTIFEITDGLTYDIHVNFEKWKKKASYTKSGYYSISYVSPSLFWNEIHMPTDEEDKKPFDLVKFLKDNLILGKFVSGANNFYLFFDNRSNEWKFGCSNYCQTIEAHFKLPDRKDREHIASILSQNKITPQQLKDAYKELGWI